MPHNSYLAFLSLSFLNGDGISHFNGWRQGLHEVKHEPVTHGSCSVGDSAPLPFLALKTSYISVAELVSEGLISAAIWFK